MATRTIFSDTDSNELDCYLNDRGEVFMNVGKPGGDGIYNGFIVLGKEDVQALIHMLSELEKEMND